MKIAFGNSSILSQTNVKKTILTCQRPFCQRTERLDATDFVKGLPCAANLSSASGGRKKKEWGDRAALVAMSPGPAGVKPNGVELV